MALIRIENQINNEIKKAYPESEKITKQKMLEAITKAIDDNNFYKLTETQTKFGPLDATEYRMSLVCFHPDVYSEMITMLRNFIDDADLKEYDKLELTEIYNSLIH